MTGEDVKRMLEAGATLVQVYTGFVYNGLGFAGQLCKSLLEPKVEPTTEQEIEVEVEHETEQSETTDTQQ
jgi:dihydroorotate dehydrogenase